VSAIYEYVYPVGWIAAVSECDIWICVSCWLDCSCEWVRYMNMCILLVGLQLWVNGSVMCTLLWVSAIYEYVYPVGWIAAVSEWK